LAGIYCPIFFSFVGGLYVFLLQSENQRFFFKKEYQFKLKKKCTKQYLILLKIAVQHLSTNHLSDIVVLA
jgi:hypothetical protein